MLLLDFMVNYADLVVSTEPIRCLPPAIIAAIIAGGASLAGAGISAASSNKANKRAADAQNQAYNQQMSVYNDQLAKNEKWYNEKMGENYMDSLEAQTAISKARDLANEQIAKERARQAVMGGTGVGISAARQSANQMLTDTTTGLAVAGQARKDQFEQTYMNRNNELTRQLIEAYGQQGANKAAIATNQAAQNAAAGSAALNTIGSIGSSLITALGGAK